MKRYLLLMAFLFAVKMGFCFNFSAVCSTGQTLYYNITSDSTVSITCPGNEPRTSDYNPYYPSSGSGFLSAYCTWYYYYYSLHLDSCFPEPTGILCIPDSVTYGDGVFRVTSIGYCAFRNTGLTKVIIPNTVTEIGEYAFEDCVALNSIYFGNKVTSISGNAFNGCTGLRHVNCNMSIIPQIFGVNTPIDTLVFGDSVQSISDGAFANMISIDSIYFGNGLLSIGAGAFSGCSNIQSIHLPEMTKIGSHAFYGCNNIREITGCDSIGACAFQNCSRIATIHTNAYYIGDNAFNNDDSLSILILTATKHIGNYAFALCENLQNVDINAHFIGTGAFAGCTNIDSLSFGDSVQSIGQYAFYGCENIVSVNVPDISIIMAEAFHGCSSLYEFIGSDSIGDRAFEGCGSLASIHTNARYIGDYAFANCDSITSISIINARNIGQSAFADCDRLSQLILGDSVQIIGDSAFFDCNNLLSVNTNAQSIGNSAFANCDSLLTVNTNSRSIGNSAFANCDRLVSVTLGDSVQTLGSGAFNGCYRLNNVTLGESITSIGDSAFRGCIRLIKPELPNSLTTIGTRAFDGCGDINGKLTFPASITHIGDSAYNGVGNITEIEMKGSTPPTIHAHTFAAVDSLVTVSVPCGAVLNYYITDYWENFPNIVEAPPYRLTVQSNNEVMGSATVTQQTTCTNHTATIYATAQTGYHFLQWNDGITTNPRSIPMTQDSAFTAIFVVNNSYITVHANDSTMGTVGGSGLYGYNAPVTLTATAYSGYHFLRWSDGNTQNPRYLAAVRDSSFTAIFVSNVSTITVANANPDMGNVGGSGVYYYQNLVSITATANYGYHFVQWNDGNTQNPRTILVSQDSSFTAYFALNTYSIVATSNSTTMGSVSGGGQYTYLHEMSMTATPAYGYHFVQWNDGVTDNPRTLTVTRDSAFTAQFAANSYTLTVAPNDASMGSAYGAGSYNYNTTATLTAVANYGYHFTQWSDAVTDNPRTVTVLNNATYTAQFEINSYVITVQSSNPAIGTTSGSGSYNYLTPVNITALPNVGYHFVQWSDGNTSNPRLISVTANATYTAQFAINSYAVGVTSNNSTMGYVSGSGTYNHNSTATLTATPYYGYHFVQWQDGNTQNPRTVTVTDSAQYTAQFAPNSYLVTALSSNVMLGTATGGGSYNYLSQVALTAVPAPHYHFTMWNDSIEDNPRTITVTQDTTLTAHFAIDRHTISVSTADATQGAVSGSSTVDYNTAVWITATANYGYHFAQWQDGNSSNPRRVVVSQDTVFTASFAPNQYTATCMANDNSRGSVTSAGGSYNYLTSITFTAVPNANYHFLRWSNGSTDNPITFTLTKDTVLTAIFVGLTANVNDNLLGTATHTKLANLVEEVTAIPNYGYHFVQWQDGNSDNPRTVTLTQDTVLTAYFAVNPYHVILNSNDSTLGAVQGGGDYNYLSQVTISATAAQHCHFVQWNDGNTTNPRLLTLTCDTAFTALFEEDDRYEVMVVTNDSVRGTVSGGGTYYVGEAVAIAANANEHYYFAQWSDGVSTNPRVVTVIGPASYTALFEPLSYQLTVTANDYAMGSVSGTGSYPYGSTATVVAQPFDNYRFVAWSDGDSQAVRTLVVVEDLQLEAHFAPLSHEGIGSVEDSPFRVRVVNGRVVVEGTDKRVSIYDVTGRPWPTDATLPNGVYFVRVGRWSTKIVVME